MSKFEKLLDQLLLGISDANFPFADLRYILLRLGFEERIKGSHHIFRKPGSVDKAVLQRMGKDAKDYQVRQVRELLLKDQMGGGTDG